VKGVCRRRRQKLFRSVPSGQLNLGRVATRRALDAATLLRELLLFLADERQHRPEPLVPHDLALMHVLQLVELALMH